MKIEESSEAVRLLRAGKDLMDVIGNEMGSTSTKATEK
jgi:hypothetical protein